jgi:hypothetical protein
VDRDESPTATLDLGVDRAALRDEAKCGVGLFISRHADVTNDPIRFDSCFAPCCHASNFRDMVDLLRQSQGKGIPAYASSA